MAKKIVKKWTVTENSEVLKTFPTLGEASFFMIYLRNIEKGDSVFSVLDNDGFIVSSKDIAGSMWLYRANLKNQLEQIDAFYGVGYFLGQ